MRINTKAQVSPKAKILVTFLATSLLLSACDDFKASNINAREDEEKSNLRRQEERQAKERIEQERLEIIKKEGDLIAKLNEEVTEKLEERIKLSEEVSKKHEKYEAINKQRNEKLEEFLGIYDIQKNENERRYNKAVKENPEGLYMFNKINKERNKKLEEFDKLNKWMELEEFEKPEEWDKIDKKLLESWKLRKLEEWKMKKELNNLDRELLGSWKLTKPEQDRKKEERDKLKEEIEKKFKGFDEILKEKSKKFEEVKKLYIEVLDNPSLLYERLELANKYSEYYELRVQQARWFVEANEAIKEQAKLLEEISKLRKKAALKAKELGLFDAAQLKRLEVMAELEYKKVIILKEIAVLGEKTVKLDSEILEKEKLIKDAFYRLVDYFFIQR